MVREVLIITGMFVWSGVGGGFYRFRCFLDNGDSEGLFGDFIGYVGVIRFILFFVFVLYL